MDIELRRLRTFVPMQQAGAISRATGRMACTQAALQMLRANIRAPRFLRTAQRLAPAPRGAKRCAKTLGVLAACPEGCAPYRAMGAVRERAGRLALRAKA